MKNNLLKFFLLFLFLCNFSYAEQFKFETSEIEIIESGNLTYAKNGKVISVDGNLEIQAQEFEYNKKLNILKAFNGITFFKLENLEIEFDEIVLDQTNLITIAKNNVKITDFNKQISIQTDFLSFNKKKNILESKSQSILKDDKNNTLKADIFEYNLDDSILKLKNVFLSDFNENNFQIETAFLNTSTNQLIGKDIIINLNNKSFNQENDPRIKGKSIVYNEGFTEVTKGIFTTCKKTDKCPPWQLSAEKIQHDSKKEIINYKNALLKVYDIPVMYFPKFFHPDPNVKRKSGFLIPTIKNSANTTNYFSIPYFSVISQNKDLTFTPRLYSNNDFLLQTEYRQENEFSSHVSDFSLFNQKEDTKSHFYYKYNKYINFANFDEGNIKLKIEKTSNDTYLRKSKLSSPLFRSLNVLENTFGINLSTDKVSFDSEFIIYEDLDKEKNSDRYEFVLPKFDITKKIDNFTNLAGNFLFKSNNLIRSYDTNILEKININNFIFNSVPLFSNSGFENNYEFIIKNINSDTKNSSSYKKDENFYLSGLFQYNSSFPLVKNTEDHLNILKPKLALKIAPNYTKDISQNTGNRLDTSNIYNLDRLSSNDVLEGGVSLTFGNDFSILDNNSSKELFSIKLANNLRLEENEDLPRRNQLNSKNSNFFGEIVFSPNDIITTKYNASTKNNLTDINYENLIAEISLNNFVTTFDYINENNTLNNNSYLSSTLKFNLNESNNIQFLTRENKSSNLTEYYNLIYQYKNDCLAASIEYNKDYYDDRDIKPEENIFLKLTIIPFGQTSSPNLKE
tara:strand:- start:3536 stop:5920 length:2385 start_codon:yes stop_codon:yes gene_type:complete